MAENNLYFDKLPNGMLRIKCPRCDKMKDFGTLQGAMTWYANHSIVEHRHRPLFVSTRLESEP